MVHTKWTKVSTRLGGKKFSVSVIRSNTTNNSNSTSTKITTAITESRSPVSKGNAEEVTGTHSVSEEIAKAEEDVQSCVLKAIPTTSISNTADRVCGKFREEKPHQPGCAGEYPQRRQHGKTKSCSFMEQYKKVDLPSYHKIFCQLYPWPPNDENLESCKYYDDSSSTSSVSLDPLEDCRPKGFESLLIVNIDGCTAVEDIWKEFPTATRVYLENMNDINSTSLFSATVQFRSVEEALRKFQDSSLKKIGRKTLEWVRSNEIKIENLPPGVTKHELKRIFPAEVKRIELRTGNRQAILRFRTAEQASRAYRLSFLFPLGDRTLGWITSELRSAMRISTCFGSLENACSGDSEGDYEKTGSELDDETEKADVGEIVNNQAVSKATVATSKVPNNRLSWQSPNYCRRTSRMLYSSKPKVFVSGLPKSVALKTLRRIFPKGLKIEVENWKSGKLAIIEFDSTICAARACYHASRVKIGGRFIKVSPRRPHGLRRTRIAAVSIQRA